MSTNPIDLPALIAKAKEPYLWSYCVVRGLVAALEATQKENEQLKNDSRYEIWCEQRDHILKAEAERDAFKTTLAALLIEYVAARKEGHIKDFPPRAQAIVRRAEAALGVEGKR